MPGKSRKKTFETLLQTKERLTRELRLRTEKRQRELLEPERLAVKEDDSDFEDSDSEEREQENNQLSTSITSLTCLLIVIAICFALIVFIIWLDSNFVCYKI